MAERGLRAADSETVLVKLVTKAVLERNLIEDGDRILIAASGGKDSTSLAYALEAIRPAIRREYSLEALHIANDFAPPLDPAIPRLFEQWGIPFHSLNVSVIGRLKEGERMSCYWCSTQRRTELLKYAVEGGFTKIALGHHLDDILETFFMNMMQKGTLSTMPMRLRYRKYPVQLIRPLGYLEERQIIRFADDQGISKLTCSCEWGNNSRRRVIRERLSVLTQDSGAVKRRMLAALATPPRDLLVEDAAPL